MSLLITFIKPHLSGEMDKCSCPTTSAKQTAISKHTFSKAVSRHVSLPFKLDW